MTIVFSDIILLPLIHNIAGGEATDLIIQILRSLNVVCWGLRMTSLIQGHVSLLWNYQPETSLSLGPTPSLQCIRVSGVGLEAHPSGLSRQAMVIPIDGFYCSLVLSFQLIRCSFNFDQEFTDGVVQCIPICNDITKGIEIELHWFSGVCVLQIISHRIMDYPLCLNPFPGEA